jgi:hypothetical protein
MENSTLKKQEAHGVRSLILLECTNESVQYTTLEFPLEYIYVHFSRSPGWESMK